MDMYLSHDEVKSTVAERFIRRAWNAIAIILLWIRYIYIYIYIYI